MNLFALAVQVLDFILPPRATQQLVDTITIAQLRTITLQDEHCGSLPYHDPHVRALVWEVKYFAHPKAVELAGILLAEKLIKISSKYNETLLLIPIPIHSARRRERGHNQTEVLCESALRGLINASHTLYEYRKDTLIRIKATPQQQGLGKHERMRNLTHSMHVARSYVTQNRTCVVVDDVSTTGATFAEATRALRDAGAAHVICIALAYS